MGCPVLSESDPSAEEKRSARRTSGMEIDGVPVRSVSIGERKIVNFEIPCQISL